MASRILGMGDVLTLIEQAERTFEADEAERMAAKLTSGADFTLEDFLEQLQAIRRMGPIGNLLGMLPGAGQMKEALAAVDDKDLDRTAAIIRSMTPAERTDPKLINGSRRLRIANGSGVTVSEVNSLVDRFFEARKMMSRMAGMGMLPGGRRNNRSTKAQEGQEQAGRQEVRTRTDPAEDAGRLPRRNARRLPGWTAERLRQPALAAAGHRAAGPVQAQVPEELSSATQASDSATCSTSLSASCRPSSMPELMCRSRCAWLACCTSRVSMVPPSLSAKFAVVSASASGAAS